MCARPRKTLPEHQHEYNKRIKMRVIAGYGGKCQCPGGCDCAVPEFLTIDHVNNDGHKDRKIRHTSGLYRWLLKNGCPRENYRLMCYNCNCGRATTRDKRCPHETRQPIPKSWQRGSVRILKRKRSSDVWEGRWLYEGRQRTIMLGKVESLTEEQARAKLWEYLPRSVSNITLPDKVQFALAENKDFPEVVAIPTESIGIPEVLSHEIN